MATAQDVNVLYNDAVVKLTAKVFVEAFQAGGFGTGINSLNVAAEGAATELEDLTDAQKAAEKAQRKLTDAQEKEVKFIEYQRRTGRISAEQARVAMGKLTKTTKVVVEAQKDFASSMKEGAAGFAKSAWKKISDPRLIAADIGRVVQATQDFSAAIEFGTDVSRGLFANMKDAARIGIDPAALSEIQATNRQALHAFGGIAKWAVQLEAAEEQMFDFIGDHAKATQFVAQQMTTLGLAGIEPTIKNFTEAQGGVQGLFQTVENLQKITGQTFAESGQMIRDFAQDEEIRFRLTAAANDKERKAILLGVTKRMEEFTALGLTIEQAKKASSALERMAGVDPRERMKRAARIRALGGAMGIPGAERLAQLEVKGRRRTKGESEEYLRLASQLREGVAEAAVGPIQQEMFISGMSKGLEDITGPGSPLDVSLAKAFGAGSANALNWETMARSTKEEVRFAVDSVDVLKQIATNLAENPLFSGGFLVLQALSAGVKTIIGLMGTGMAMQAGKAGLGKLLPAGGRAAAMAGGMTMAATGAGVALITYGTLKMIDSYVEQKYGRSMKNALIDSTSSLFEWVGDKTKAGLQKTGLIEGPDKGKAMEAMRLQQESTREALRLDREIGEARKAGDTDRVKELLQEIANNSRRIYTAEEQLVQTTENMGQQKLAQDQTHSREAKMRNDSSNKE